jgi:dienelactone hydrolase
MPRQTNLQRWRLWRYLAILSLGLAHPYGAWAETAAAGQWQGSAWSHTGESLIASLQNASLVLPGQATGGAQFSGRWGERPATIGRPVAVVLFMHGSSGLGLKAIAQWQQWLASLGVASLAPDSFALPARVTYTSPIDVALYERIHALRMAEIAPALSALQREPWADKSKLILAGASEGGVPVARYAGDGFMARMVFSWSCEPNYFVSTPRNAFAPNQPVLNVMSTTDPFFSPSNAWLGLPNALGHCGEALKGNAEASVVLIPGAPHTLLNLPAARDATAGFLARVGAL